MVAFIFVMLITWAIVWVLFKFMYPKPPIDFAPKEGDVTTLRACDYCGHTLAQYRGIVVSRPAERLTQADITQVQTLRNQREQLCQQLETQQQQDVSTLSKQAKKAHNETQAHLQAQIAAYDRDIEKITTWFFCNQEHEQAFASSHTVASSTT